MSFVWPPEGGFYLSLIGIYAFALIAVTCRAAATNFFGEHELTNDVDKKQKQNTAVRFTCTTQLSISLLLGTVPLWWHRDGDVRGRWLCAVNRDAL